MKTRGIPFCSIEQVSPLLIVNLSLIIVLDAILYYFCGDSYLIIVLDVIL